MPIISVDTSHHIPRLFTRLSHSRDVQPKVESSLSWSSVSCGLPGAALCWLKTGLAGKQPAISGPPFQGVGVSHGSSSSPFLSSFAAFWGGQPRVGSLFWRALLTHLHSLELELLHNSPWCRHRLLRPALRYTSLHAQYCTIPPTHSFTSQLRTAAAAGKQNTPFHHISLPRRGTWTPAETRR